MNPKQYSSWSPTLPPSNHEKVVKQRLSGPSDAKRKQLRKKR